MDPLSWPVGPLTVGQFVKQRNFGRAQLTRRGDQSRFANPSLKARQLFPPHRYCLSWPRFWEEKNWNIEKFWNYSAQAQSSPGPILCYGKPRGGACSWRTGLQWASEGHDQMGGEYMNSWSPALCGNQIHLWTAAEIKAVVVPGCQHFIVGGHWAVPTRHSMKSIY